MEKRPFFLTAVLLAIVAFGLQAAAYNVIDKRMHLRAAEFSAAVKQNRKAQPIPEAARLKEEAHTLDLIGITTAMFSVVLLLIAARRRESGWYSIPLLLLFFALMSRMLL